jgi:hypothetical protein
MNLLKHSRNKKTENSSPFFALTDKKQKILSCERMKIQMENNEKYGRRGTKLVRFASPLFLF